MLSLFKTAVKKDFREQKSSYSTYPTSFVSKRAATVHSKNSHLLHLARYRGSLKTALPVPNQITNQRFLGFRSSHARHAFSSLRFSHTTSPTSTPGSPVTPVGGPDLNPKIRGVDQSPLAAFRVIEVSILHIHPH
jgi:hypothetical protein